MKGIFRSVFPPHWCCIWMGERKQEENKIEDIVEISMYESLCLFLSLLKEKKKESFGDTNM